MNAKKTIIFFAVLIFIIQFMGLPVDWKMRISAVLAILVVAGALSGKSKIGNSKTDTYDEIEKAEISREEHVENENSK